MSTNPLDLGPDDMPPRQWDDEPPETPASFAQEQAAKATGKWLSAPDARRWLAEQEARAADQIEREEHARDQATG